MSPELILAFAYIAGALLVAWEIHEKRLVPTDRLAVWALVAFWPAWVIVAAFVIARAVLSKAGAVDE